MQLKKWLVACALTLVAGVSLAAPVEGTQYVKLDKPVPAWQGTLTKVFSYDCRFCFRYDTTVDPKVIPLVLKDTGLAFNPVHLETKGVYGRTASEFLAMCLLKDKAAGRTNMDKDSLFVKVKDALYQAYHREEQRWEGGEAAFIETMSQASGISAADFAKERRTAPVQKLADSWKASAYDVALKQGIPAFVVNGKYLVLNKSLRNVKSLIELLDDLGKMP